MLSGSKASHQREVRMGHTGPALHSPARPTASCWLYLSARGRRVGWGFQELCFSLQACPGTEPPTHQHPVLCREVHIDAWAPHLLKGQEDNQTHTLTFCAQQGFRSPLPHSFWGAGKSFSTSNLCPSSCCHWRRSYPGTEVLRVAKCEAPG